MKTLIALGLAGCVVAGCSRGYTPKSISAVEEMTSSYSAWPKNVSVLGIPHPVSAYDFYLASGKDSVLCVLPSTDFALTAQLESKVLISALNKTPVEIEGTIAKGRVDVHDVTYLK